MKRPVPIDESESPSKRTDTKDSEPRFETLVSTLNSATMTAISRMGFSRMTEIQARVLPQALAGIDIAACAPTGAGKTLAYIIPIVDLLLRANFRQRNGLGAVIVAPTREIVLQIHGVLRQLLTGHSQTHLALVGGGDRRHESNRLKKGVTVIVSTPGRLAEHLKNTKGFIYHNCKALVVDEVDRVLGMGFKQELESIASLLPADRQTLLFSATQSEAVSEICALATRGGIPVYIGVGDTSAHSTRKELTQGFVECTSQDRFKLLYTLLKRKRKKKKLIVFFATCAEVQFYYELLNYCDIPALHLHGRMKSKARSSTFFEFANASAGVLLCTDVAARGVDIPAVDWIIQYDPPSDPNEYVHRVGRTARGIDGATGQALLFLLPQEQRFVKYLELAGVPLTEYEFTKQEDIQDSFEAVVSENRHLHQSAADALQSYVQWYAQEAMKDVFDFRKLSLDQVARSFGFDSCPEIDFKVSVPKLTAAELED